MEVGEFQLLDFTVHYCFVHECFVHVRLVCDVVSMECVLHGMCWLLFHNVPVMFRPRMPCPSFIFPSRIILSTFPWKFAKYSDILSLSILLKWRWTNG